MISILGISAFYHDSAAAIIIDGKIVAAAQEERFTRKKHDSSYPFNAIEFVLNYTNLKLNQLDFIVFYEKPFLKFERLLETYLAFAPSGFKSFCSSMPIWLREKLFQKKMIFNKLKTHDNSFNDVNKIYFSEHHLSHAASAFYPSPFEDAIILIADGVGEWATTTVAIGKGNKLEILKEIHFPHSLGLLYSAFTYFTGFKVNSGEYKLMGLAPYGKPKYKNLILDNLIDVKDDGTFKLNQSYFKYATGLRMTNEKFNKLFGQKPRNPKNEKLTQFHMDVATSIQSVTEIILLKLTRSLFNEYKIPNLCLAGGVALNCVANGKILKDKVFKNIWIQPAAGDAGGSLGAALGVWHIELNKNRKTNNNKDSMMGSYLGPEYSENEIVKFLKHEGAKFEICDENKIVEKTCSSLKEGKAIGWFQGRMEFGPRALGNRSIIADSRSTTMQKNLNLKVKYRESFRPFAPSITSDDVSEWFNLDCESPYMMFVSNVDQKKCIKMTKDEEKLFGIDKLNIKRSEISAVTHVDYSARIQTVHKETNLKYHKLISEFKKRTGCPVIVNTSFNVRGEPIVNTPKDAFDCFMGTELDILVIGNCFLVKENQNQSLKKDYKHKYELD
jgi:carbamoyltransferase|tara:strand:- start:1945 stop:3786 length:1842 start_codon:yes stop_codon:yes gene_type:complete